mmetsp:Transcript_7288/g.18712  ORF Transcript_7288/g.18712 Transcript_7288/m.18712 type:complete len:165 (+) Transcript_7288:584-1078(+)|eukprot:CAMPEP_0182916752 /NCGR_PEP_ID=MMETSP0105_2-20130417/1128_1 /TAXON_ID=81532 ORGANISM="Acanthoeca-like sp., Strain 10tr" /NCGR_SAMPLE_ID=MMETSP0105_2 /ASSEMBLY_ACC=CAM_ASM_000205 /LENGTH=164 /DNA_ID=CAMNT_0025053717 /DNA_START=492 /DNA_END=986 /DNA_ORIENTATION=+
MDEEWAPTFDLDRLPHAGRGDPFHFHVYFKAETEAVFAVRLRATMLSTFHFLADRGIFMKAGFLHPSPMFVVAIDKKSDRGKVNDVIEWLEANRKGLSVLVHPHTTDGFVDDHTTHEVWLGTPLELGVIPTLRRVQRWLPSTPVLLGGCALAAVLMWRKHSRAV